MLINILLIGILLAALLPGCHGPGAASFPIEVKISFSDSPVLGKPVQVTATFNLVKDYFKEVVRGVDANIELSEGFQLISGDLEWQGDFLRGQTYTITATIKSIKTGTRLISANAWSELDGANGFTGLYVTVNQNGASISDRMPSGPTKSPVPTSAPSSPVSSVNGTSLPLQMALYIIKNCSGCTSPG